MAAGRKANRKKILLGLAMAMAMAMAMAWDGIGTGTQSEDSVNHIVQRFCNFDPLQFWITLDYYFPKHKP